MSTVWEGKDKGAERESKRRHVTTGMDKASLELHFSNVTTPIGKLIYHNGLWRVGTYDRSRKQEEVDSVEVRGSTDMNSDKMYCL